MRCVHFIILATLLLTKVAFGSMVNPQKPLRDFIIHTTTYQLKSLKKGTVEFHIYLGTDSSGTCTKIREANTHQVQPERMENGIADSYLSSVLDFMGSEIDKYSCAIEEYEVEENGIKVAIDYKILKSGTGLANLTAKPNSAEVVL